MGIKGIPHLAKAPSAGKHHVDPSKVAELSEKGQNRCRYVRIYGLFANVLYDALSSSIETM